VSDLDLPIALAREVMRGAGALRVSVLVDRGEAEPPAIVELERLGPVRVTQEGAARELPHDAGAGVALPAGFPQLRQLPPFEVLAEEGRVAGPPGGLEMLARALRDVAALLGGESVVAAELPVHGDGQPLGLAARAGDEPVVVLLGDDAFELDLPDPPANA
jgi:hypothetical protein